MPKKRNPDLFGRKPEPFPRPLPDNAFDGITYDPAKDHKRLEGLLGKVHDLMLDGQWRTLAKIRNTVGGTEASVSARLRDLRKDKYGALIVERKRLDGGLYAYRLVIPDA